jgi:hypothetical protein
MLRYDVAGYYGRWDLSLQVGSLVADGISRGRWHLSWQVGSLVADGSLVASGISCGRWDLSWQVRFLVAGGISFDGSTGVIRI